MPPILEVSSTNKYTVNMAHFNQRDLALFVESLELISRRKREQYEQQQKQFANTHIVHAEVHQRPSSHTKFEEKTGLQTLDEDMAEADETYFSGPDSARNSQRSSVALSNNMDLKVTPSIIGSDSEESGVFPVADNEAQLNYSPPRPRSEVISKPRTRTTRARIIGLVLKREYTGMKSEDDIIEDDTIKAERCDRVVDEMIKQKFLTLKGKYCQRKKSICEGKKSSSSAEERFINKALRYLTL